MYYTLILINSYLTKLILLLNSYFDIIIHLEVVGLLIMNIEKLEKYAKKINFMHLYFSQLQLTKMLNYENTFAKYENFDLVNGIPSDNTFDFIFIEIDKLDKQNFRILNEVIKKSSTKNIFIFATDYKNDTLAKFLIYLSLNHALPLKNDEEEIDKILLESLKKYHNEALKTQQLEISNKIDSSFSFLFFKNKNLTYANDNAKALFGSHELSSLKTLIKRDEDINSLIDADTDEKVDLIIKNSNDLAANYTVYTRHFNQGREKLICMIESNSQKEQINSNLTIDRFQFIETLKDNLAQNILSKNPVLLMFINICNYGKLKTSDSNIDLFNLTKKVAQGILSQKSENDKLIYWDNHFFVLSLQENDFGKAKEILETVHKQLIHEDYEKEFFPSITSSLLDVSSLELNECITCIENINNDMYDKSDFKTDDFFELSNLNAYLSENDQIEYHLKKFFKDKTPIKLLNIYKGLCINTQSKILKIKDDSYFATCENLQAYSMRFENKTVIQAPGLAKDIQAYISYINIEKNYVILNQLSFLNFSANNRQHTRVQPRIRMPISLKYLKYNYQGEILDISTQAIAFVLNHITNDDYMYKDVRLNFRTPNSSNEEGYDLMDIEAKVVNLIEIGETKTKVVAMINLEKPYETYLLKYMYDRQKELILELKQASRF
jgi:hypothetical protein